MRLGKNIEINDDTVVIFLFLLFVLLVGIFVHDDPKPQPKHAQTSASTPDTDVQFLKDTYLIDNVEYFDGKLPVATIRTEGAEPGDMATVVCSKDGAACEIRFNLRYVAAPKVAELVMLHEQCHIAAWAVAASKDEEQHGPTWQRCMLGIDARGAFRDILIDGYARSK